MNIRDLVFSGNLEALNNLLCGHPELANADFSLPDNPATEHPLHRICDGVFSGYYSEDKGLELAKMFIKHGTDVNIHRLEGKDSPLTAACSLHCDQLALFYIQHGARVEHRGCHGGTALHWASWCGRDILVQEIVHLSSDINQRCFEFKSTPFFWAIHGYKFGGKGNRHHQINCARILLDRGADPSIPNAEGYLPKQLLDNGDQELLDLFDRNQNRK